MPVSAVRLLNFRDFHVLAPEIVLAVWGLVVLMLDLTALRKRTADQRREANGWLALVGVFLAIGAAFVPLLVRFDIYGMGTRLNFAGIDYTSSPDPYIFFGTLADDLLTQTFNIIQLVLLALVVRMSMAWSFTENWGEYFALLLWSTVGMMLLAASEEFLTLFLTLETMTICLYLATAFESNRRRSAEAGFKYFVYGSVSSALFLFGLSLVYGLTGTTRFFAIRQVLQPIVGQYHGLAGNVTGISAVLLMMVGFGFKIAAVPFHQWAPDAYEGAPAPVTAWIATGSKIASFIALMKVLLMALLPWGSDSTRVMSPGWIGVVVVLSAASMTFGNFAALAQRNLKRMLAYSSIAHAGYMLVGVAAAGVSTRHQESAGSVLYYLVIYGFSNIGAFAVAAWLARDKKTDDIEDLNGLGLKYPGLGVCILFLMLSLIGMPPLAGFFGKLYMFMEALNQSVDQPVRVALTWLVALGLINSVVSAFYYVRVLKAMFLRNPARDTLAPASTGIALPIVLATAVVIGFGVWPAPLVEQMRGAAVQMLSVGGAVNARGQVGVMPPPPPGAAAKRGPAPKPELPADYQRRMMQMQTQTPPAPTPATKKQSRPSGPSAPRKNARPVAK
jgi:NADH-quinone oxidoreductase subunit N